MRRSLLRVLWALALGSATAVGFACGGGETTEPGFEELGAGGGATGASSSTSATSTSATTAASSTSASSTSATTGTSTSASSTSSGQACDDPGPEPNDTEATAVAVPDLDDADPSPYPHFEGVLDGPNDVDWFTYVGTDAFGAAVDPARNLTVVGGARICKFAACISGSTTVVCSGGAQDATSPSDLPGCCGSGSIALSDVDCSGTVDDDAVMYIRLDQAVDACVGYAVDYHY
jgi:hypothetical protein